jgi:hypothetical protein
MVFFHGGGETQGSAQDYPWDLAPPLVGHGVIVVTAEYRLGLLGFFAHPLLTTESGTGSSGNYGLMDMIAALPWVHDNIAGFGGDATRVMIFGQSAGSANVQGLLASPEATGLFTSAGMESYAFRSNLLGIASPTLTPLLPISRSWLDATQLRMSWRASVRSQQVRWCRPNSCPTSLDPNDPNGVATRWLPYDAAENILQLGVQGDDTIANLPGGYRNTQCDFLGTVPNPL